MVAVLVIGEVIVYTSDYTNYSADIFMERDIVTFNISSNGAKPYTALVLDNGWYGPIDRLYIYLDTSYPLNYKNVDVSIGAHALNQEYYVKQIINLLKPRGFTDIMILNAAELTGALKGDLGSRACGTAGLLVVSGALPDTVYTGSENDTILEWISAGGRLYWVGSLIGSCYASHDELHPVNGYQEFLFGAECLNTFDVSTVYEEVSDNVLTSALSLQNNDIRYGVDVSRLPEGTDNLEIGFTSSGYVSIAVVQHESGMIYVFGGDYSHYQIYDVVQTIAAGVGLQTEVKGLTEGSVNGRTSISVEGIEGTNISAYVYLGGYYPVFGKLIWL